MLRSTRGLLLLAIALVIGAVAATYYNQKRTQAKEAPRPPKSLPLNTEARATTWVWRKDEATHGIVEIRAKRFRQIKDPSLVEIEDVEVLIYKNQGRQYDRIRSAKARFDNEKGTLYSDGDVDITMSLPVEGLPRTRPLEIHSSGVTYEANTGKAYTDRLATFQFALGEGKAVGALYDPNSAELTLKSQVELNWRGRGANGTPMKIEAGELIYKEKDSYVLLRPWSRLTKDTGVLDAGEAVVTLAHGVIDKIEAERAHGTEHQPGRTIEYSASRFGMKLTPKGEVESLYGEPDARLVSLTTTSRTTIACRRVDLDFDVSSGTSALKQALASGGTVLETAPVPHQGVPPPETRVIQSDRMLLKMRPGGQDIESAETLAPGHMDFLPNQPNQRRRSLDASHMLVSYGPGNILQSFHASDAATRTEPLPSRSRKDKNTAPMVTWSKDLAANFDSKTGQLTRMEQWNDFRYQEGDRQARALHATLDEAHDAIALEGSARVWDASGTTSANRILLDQKTGDVRADGHVVSTRMPDRKGNSSAMLSNDQPLEAQADAMRTTERNQKVHYQGHAAAWQGSNRIWADVIDIDRASHTLAANGHVRTQLIEQQSQKETTATDGAAAKPQQPPTFVMIEAAALLYTESTRMAHYTGGVHLARPGMTVGASEIRAYLSEAGSDSSLDHAVADGHVEIVRRQPGRTLTGTGEHSEYYAKDERVFLSGGEPVLVDSVRGTTRGRELTYYAKDDKLLVNGVEKDPVTTRILRRH